MNIQIRYLLCLSQFILILFPYNILQILYFLPRQMFSCWQKTEKLENQRKKDTNPIIQPRIPNPNNHSNPPNHQTDKIRNFKDEFIKNIDSVNNKMMNRVEIIQSADKITTLQALSEQNWLFWSFNNLFHQNNDTDAISRGLALPFKMMEKSKQDKRKLVLCVNQYLERLKGELTNEPMLLQEDPIFRSTLSKLQPILNKKFEDAIDLVRKRQEGSMRKHQQEKQVRSGMYVIQQELPDTIMDEQSKKSVSHLNPSEQLLSQEEPSKQSYQQLKKQNLQQQQPREDSNIKQNSISDELRERMSFEYQIRQLENENRELQKFRREYEEINLRLNDELTKLSQENDNLKFEFASLQQDSSELIDRNTELSRIVEQLKEEKYTLVRKATHDEATISQLKYEKEELLSQLQTFKQKLQRYEEKRTITYSQLELKVLFQGNVLYNKEGEKRFLINAINTHMMANIEKTNLLYTFSRDKSLNFHKFVDKKSSIVLIIETKNALIACYYSGEVKSEGVMDEQALIISLDKRKVYKLNNFRNFPNKDPKDTRSIRGMTYDPYYLIFGNAEVRIKSEEARVFSNLGINNSYFNSEGAKSKDLLNDSQNEVDLLDYQIYEAVFYDYVNVRQ